MFGYAIQHCPAVKKEHESLMLNRELYEAKLVANTDDIVDRPALDFGQIRQMDITNSLFRKKGQNVE